MNVAVLGLGVEGKSAVNSLLKRGYEVYASDLNKKILVPSHPNLEIDLGIHDFDKIQNADTIIISPSLWNNPRFNELKNSKKLLSDILRKYKNVKTILVTGTNGKTTTTLMITDILRNAGYKVLAGGNAGGGFQGYNEIILKAEENKYDFLVVEVCDMTLEYCKDIFSSDLVVITNQGRDHMDVHKSPDDYRKSLQEFIKGKIAILNGIDNQLVELGVFAKEKHFFKEYDGQMKVFGKYNRQNAAAAVEVARFLDIDSEIIEISLENFEEPIGRTTAFDLSKSRVIIGKTDNADAIKAVLNEDNFELIIVGTPREGEYWRLEILDEINKHHPPMLGLFPGLEPTVTKSIEYLNDLGYSGQIIEFEDYDEVISFVIRCQEKFPLIFIGGNGQDKLINIYNELKKNIGLE